MMVIGNDPTETAILRKTDAVKPEPGIDIVVPVQISITGGSGFLGREILRSASTAIGDRVEVRDRHALEQAFAQQRADVVIHTAYRRDGPDAWAINVEGSANVAIAAAAMGARLLHISTDVVFDGRAGAPYTEADRPNPITDYGRSKAAAEEAVVAHHPNAVIVRTSLILGGPGHEPSQHEVAVTDPAAVFFDDEMRSPIAVFDLASALIELSVMGVTGVLNVAGADDLSRAEIARDHCRWLGATDPLPAGTTRRLPSRLITCPRTSPHTAARHARGV